MALASRLWRLLPVRHGAAPGPWLLRTPGSVGPRGARLLRGCEVTRCPGVCPLHVCAARRDLPALLRRSPRPSPDVPALTARAALPQLGWVGVSSPPFWRKRRLGLYEIGFIFIHARDGHSGLKVVGNPRTIKKGLSFSALSYLSFETYQVICQAAVVHAIDKVEEVLEQADYLYESGETEKLYQLLIQYKESEDAELLWRLARASRDIAQLSRTSEEEKKVLVYEALEYAKRALEKNESSFAAHKWYAICISDVGDYEGIKVKIANAYVIKKHFEKAIELNPKDATSIHLMGIWCYTFAEMPWYQRRIAKVLFANPPSATYEEVV